MKLKNVLLLGSCAWIGYMLYSRYKTDKKLKDLTQQVKDQSTKLASALANMAISYTDPPEMVSAPSTDDALFPAGIKNSYNTAKNSTVSQPSTEVILNN